MLPDRRSHLLCIAALFAVIHGVLLLHGLSHPEAFMAGDRASSRLAKIEYVFGAEDSTRPSLTRRLVETGTPGDYAIHGVFYRLGGKPLVIAVQLLASFLSLMCIYQLALLLGCSPRLALAAVLIYMVLPGSLILPHQLASESLYNPLVVMGLYLICKNIEQPFRFSTFSLGLALLAVAIGLRVLLVLYPFLLAPILACGDRQHRWSRIALVLSICFVIPLGWAFFVRSQTGQMSVKSHDNNPALEFFKTANKTAVVGRFEFDAAAYPSGTMPAGEFLVFIAEHPLSYAKLKAMDVANLALNPGIYSLLGHHLGMLEGAGDTDYWKTVRNQEGYSAVAREIMRRGPFLALAIVLSLALWSLVLLGTACGLYFFVRNDQPSWVTKAVLLSFTLYSCLIVQVSTDVRWGHRTPIEFLMAILCVIAIDKLTRQGKHTSDSNEQFSRGSAVSADALPNRFESEESGSPAGREI